MTCWFDSSPKKVISRFYGYPRSSITAVLLSKPPFAQILENNQEQSMTAVKARLDRLEMKMGSANGSGLLAVVRCGSDTKELDSLLLEKGIDRDDPRHTVIILRTLFEDRDGDMASKQMPAKILSITEQK